MTVLRVAGREVGRYGWDTDPPGDAVPRPAADPLRTLAGTLATDAYPADHPWHRGLGLGLPDVDGVNLWGGPTYLAGVGYRDTGHGSVVRLAACRKTPCGVEESLAWCTATGGTLLREARRLAVRAHDERCWSLAWTSELTAVPPGGVRLASPGSNGRAGAGYGGLFWRLPRAEPMRIFTDRRCGDAVNGERADWAAVTAGEGSAAWSGIVAPRDPRTAADPWFVRATDYPAIGSALAGERPVGVPAGETIRISMRVVLVDGILDAAGVAALLSRIARQ